MCVSRVAAVAARDRINKTARGLAEEAAMGVSNP